ncbi:hypothetical protein BTO04_00475 [Polaribacter sp. SA4-10]|uniref:hypothetical protein n=1 Tax=Polaribacter sp. SA4-10 TaxID=754397 RepID=UPI000B3C7C49|nr:hypothetical protein [Polaribacter sp. SA4-10]ARV05258.1 hypothetical protein BTO04_00475 [Polaribacter sp. SA4-10]
MKKIQRKERFLIIATRILLLSILLMIIVIPGVYAKTLSNENNLGAVIGISLAIIIRVVIIIWYKLIIKKIRSDGEKRKTGYIVIGILLIIFGLIYLDGAFAFLDNKDILYVSYLMFTSVFCDFIATTLTFIALFLKSQKVN